MFERIIIGVFIHKEGGIRMLNSKVINVLITNPSVCIKLKR